MTGHSTVFGAFVGSTPAGEAIRLALQIPQNENADLIQWALTLHQDPRTLAPTTYHLRCRYGLTEPGNPGLGKDQKRLDKTGVWRTAKGTRARQDAVVYEMDGVLSLVKVDPDVVHVLGADRSLMIGNGGWSYTLNRRGASEKEGDGTVEVSGPDRSYAISQVLAGPTVFGIFDGRSPCQAITRALALPQVAGCVKVKWRIALYQNPETLAPTTYRIESSLHRRVPREGAWTIVRGTGTDPQTIVYRLGPTGTERALFLLHGDDNVLFFLDHNLEPLIGSADYSYTLDRRIAR